MAKPLNEQGRKAQAQALRKAGYEAEAKQVERGQVEFDPDWLEAGCPDD